MTLEQAIRILHPGTSGESLNEILGASANVSDGLRLFNEKTAEATVIACEVMQRDVGREKGCEFCNNQKPITQDCDNGYSLEVEDGEISMWDGDRCVAIFSAERCPMCGKPLNEGRVDGDE